MSAGSLFAPLAGIRVIDASRVLAGPFCGSILADLGAEVIRVEHPVPQDEIRAWAPRRGEVSAPFNAVNHSKRSLALDFDAEGGLDVLKRLLAGADVFIENFRPATMERLGLDWEQLHALNPRLIHCSVRAFPSGTSKEKMPGYEASMQAHSGIMSLTGENGAPPVRCGPSVVDLGTGFVSTVAVLSALRERDRTGEGIRVEPALMRTAANLLCYQIAGYSLSGVMPQRQGSGHDALVPYRVFQAADGPVFVAAGNDRLWTKLADLLGLRGAAGLPYPTLAERIAARPAVDALVAAAIAGFARADLLARLAAGGIPAAPVNDISEFMADPSLLSAGVLQQVAMDDGTELTTAGPLFAAEGFAPPRRAAPSVGQDSEAVLTALGYSAADIAALRASRTVA